ILTLSIYSTEPEVMEAAIQTVVKVYLKSAKGKDNMSGGNFDSLVMNHLGNIMPDTKEKVTAMRKERADNQDGKISFKVYMKFIGQLASTMSEAYTRSKQSELAQTATAGTNSAAPVPESDKAAAAPAAVAAEPAKEGAAEAAAAKPEPVTVAAAAAGGAAAAAAAAAVVAVPEVKVVAPAVEVVAPAVEVVAPAVVVEEKKPEEKEEEAPAAAPLAEAEVKSEEASS
ncbi:hypothetical protein CRUP_005725, partial [Coryphaenoides rupestris]